jgi:hypothetical protein
MRFCSGSRSAGEVRVYFNRSVETSLALGEAAQGNVDLVPKLIERIDAAQGSIDAACYSFDLAGPADALIAAHNRGVAIRFVTDDRGGVYQAQVNRLIAAGITVIDDAYGPNNGGAELMHDKFWVFDHRADADYANDWVLTGSWNVNDGGTYTDIQDIILLQDESVAEVYTAEIDEMWGSTTDTPDPNLSRFSALKIDDTPKHFLVGGIRGSTAGPSDNTMPCCPPGSWRPRHSAATAFSHSPRSDVSNALLDRFQGVPGFLPVRGLRQRAGSSGDSSTRICGTGTYPWDHPPDVCRLDTEGGSLHHKYMILDVNQRRPADRHHERSSWSNAANNGNDENIPHDRGLPINQPVLPGVRRAVPRGRGDGRSDGGRSRGPPFPAYRSRSFRIPQGAR